MQRWNRWQDWLNVILGIALMASPWILGATGTAAVLWSGLVGGAVIAIVGLWALYQPEGTVPEWVNVVLGVWVIVSPFVLGFSNMANVLWYNVVLGVIVGILAFWTERQVEAGHGAMRT